MTRYCADCPVRQDGFFAQLSTDQLAELDRTKTLDDYPQGHILFYQGHHPLAVYCILSGYLKLYQSVPSGQRHIMRIAGPGEMVGQETLLNEKAYEASAEAMGACRVCILPGAQLIDILHKNPSQLLKIIQEIKVAQHQAKQGRDELARKPVRARLARLLLDLKKKFGISVQGQAQINLSLSRAELADLISTTPETIIRFLNLFKKEGWIALPRAQTIVIRNEKALKAAARESRAG